MRCVSKTYFHSSVIRSAKSAQLLYFSWSERPGLKEARSAGVLPNAAYFLQAKPFGVRQLAAAFKGTLEEQAYWAVFKSGSELPHSEGALRAQKVCGIRQDAGTPKNFNRWTASYCQAYFLPVLRT
jgi:hypothetical protein